MAGAVDEPVAVAGLRDHSARGPIHLRAGRQLRRLDQPQRGITRLENDRSDALDFFRHFVAQEIDARQIAGNATGRVQRRGEIEQQDASATGHRRVFLRRQIVRIGRVRVDRDHRSAFGDHSLLRPPRLQELEQLVFGGRIPFAHAPGCFLRHRFLIGREQVGRARLRRELLGRQDAHDLRHQIRARHHLGPQRPDELDRAGVDAAEGGNVVARRILHGDFPQSAQHRGQFMIARPPGRVDRGRARHTVERFRLDGVHQLARLASCRDQAVPTARAHAGVRQAEHAIGDLVGLSKIEEEPAVELVGLQDGLDLRELRRRQREQEGEDHSLPPAPRKASSRSRNSTLNVVSDP